MKSSVKHQNHRSAGLGVLFSLNNFSPPKATPARPNRVGVRKNLRPPVGSPPRDAPPRTLIIARHRRVTQRREHERESEEEESARSESDEESSAPSFVSPLKSPSIPSNNDESDDNEDEEEDEEENDESSDEGDNESLSNSSASSASSKSVPVAKRHPSTFIRCIQSTSSDEEASSQRHSPSTTSAPRVVFGKSAGRKRLEQRQVEALFDDLPSESVESEDDVHLASVDEEFLLEEEEESEWSHSDSEPSSAEDELVANRRLAKAAYVGREKAGASTKGPLPRRRQTTKPVKKQSDRSSKRAAHKIIEDCFDRESETESEDNDENGEAEAIVCSDTESYDEEDLVEAEVVLDDDDDDCLHASHPSIHKSPSETNTESTPVFDEVFNATDVNGPGHSHPPDDPVSDSMVDLAVDLDQMRVSFNSGVGKQSGDSKEDRCCTKAVNATMASVATTAGEKEIECRGVSGTLTIDRKPAPQLRREGSVRPGLWALGPKIGMGAFGVVYVGMNTATGTLMAVKQVTTSRAVMKDLRREIDLMKELKHPNIVRYYGAEMDKSTLHIFQEWVPGGSVARLLSKFGPFSLPVIRSYLSQILEGLSFLHASGVMHRDIKGSNILVNSDGVVKLCDFGGSKKLGSEIMQKHTMRGTPYFCAPEVFEENYHFKGDIWSVGCVVFQMATGVPPWKDSGLSNPVSLYNYIKCQTSPPTLIIPHSEDVESSAALKTLVAKCFVQDPDQRPTAQELLKEPFLHVIHSFSDDDISSNGRGLFSPSSTCSWEHLETPLRADPSSLRISRHQRRSSIGSPARPFQSPPLPKRHSPHVDTKDWPSWARASKDAPNDASCDSLQVSSTSSLKENTKSTASESPVLAGLRFLAAS